MSKTREAFKTVNWREYLDPTDKPRVQSFLKLRGNLVLGNIVDNIINASELDLPSLAIMVHPNVSAVTIVHPDEYQELLTHCQQFFEKHEEYEKCEEIVQIKKIIKEKKKKFW